MILKQEKQSDLIYSPIETKIKPTLKIPKRIIMIKTIFVCEKTFEEVG